MAEMDVILGGLFENNDTSYHDDYEYESPPEEGMRRFIAVLLPVLYYLGLVLGVLGNGLVLGILVQRRWRDGWSVADTFILHLGLADSLLLFTLPFRAAQEHGWSFGTPLCKITGAVYNINFYCGIYLLVCISLYLSIGHVTQIYSHKKPWMVQGSCLSVWLCSVLLSIPDWIFLEAQPDCRGDRTVCFPNYRGFSQSATTWRLASRFLYHIGGFLVPSAILLFCYTRILLQRGSRGLRKHKAVLVLVLVFFLCWTPYNITLIVDTLMGEPAKTEQEPCDEGRLATETSLVLTAVLGCLHACLNPLLYLWLWGNFRREVLGRMRRAQTQPSPSLWDFGVAEEERVPDQCQEEKSALNQVQVQSTHM